MRTRIWEDTAAMNIVSVLGYLLNDEAEVVGPERTQVLCKLMPSIHTPIHRSMLSMLITGLNDADTQIFFNENGLMVLNQWLLESIKTSSNTKKDKIRQEMFALIRALLRVLDTTIQTDVLRKQHGYLCETFIKITNLLEKESNSEYAAEWSRLNIYRRHFESSCGLPSSIANISSTTSRSTAESIVPSSSSSSSSTRAPSTNTTTTTTNSTPPPPPKFSPASILQYQPKSFLTKQSCQNPQEEEEEEEEDQDMSESIITNTTSPAMSASLDAKIRQNGHVMSYIERMKCRLCERMTAKQCEKCRWCVKCAQRNPCKGTPSLGNPFEPTTTPTLLSVTDRNVQVLSSAMDQAVYKAFKEEDFYSIFSLIQNGMDVNYQRAESDGSTALMAAAYHGRQDAVQKLLKLGANPCLLDASNGKTAHAFAQQKGHEEVATCLLQAMQEWKSNEMK